jgi:glycosyltransferase involved in cell wall biosynthesis
MIQDDPQLKAAGQWKQNDLLFRGFAKFIKQSAHTRSVLVMPDRTQSNDITLGKRMIREMGLEPHVIWLQPPRPEGFTRDELIPFYSIADVVADDFGIGWFGSVVLEALSISRPVVTYIDENVMKRLYPWHPILSARTEEEIANHFMALYHDEKLKKEIGKRGRAWVEAFHSEEGTGPVYVRQITQFCERLI